MIKPEGHKIQNVFVLGKNKDAVVAVVLSDQIHFFDYDDLKKEPIVVSGETFLGEKHGTIWSCARIAFGNKPASSKFDFWLCLNGTPQGMLKVLPDIPKSHTHTTGGPWNGKNGYAYTAAFVKVSIDLDKIKTDKGNCITMNQKQSIMINDEYGCGCSEYTQDCLLLSFAKNSNVAKVENFEKYTVVQAPPGVVNDNKNWMGVLPLFNPEKPTEFPFMVLSGAQEMWLVNLETCKMQSLIKSSSKPSLGQVGAQFLTTEKLGKDRKVMRMIFATEKVSTGQMKQFEIHEMTFFEDFYECLNQLNYIPEVSTKHVVELEMKIKEIESGLKEIQGIKDMAGGEDIEKNIKALIKMLSDKKTGQGIDENNNKLIN